jgi:hypothetical protein
MTSVAMLSAFHNDASFAEAAKNYSVVASDCPYDPDRSGFEVN